MADFKTPGVYVQEISTLPASIAPVATAIPAFVGYTAQREKNGETIPINKPVRVTSYLEYKEIFGESYPEDYGITLTLDADGNTQVAINDPTNFSPYRMTYQVYMYFNNGGGPCYIVSVGDMVPGPNPAPTSIVATALIAGINALEEEDEPTLLVVPEAVILSTIDRKTVHETLLTQCAKLQDRFALMDTLHITGQTVAEDGATFRAEVGTSDLKYGASYYPSLKTSLYKYYSESKLTITDNRGGVGLGPFHNKTLNALGNGDAFATATIRINNYDNLDQDVFNIGSGTYEEGDQFNKASSDITTADALEDAIDGSPEFSVSRAGNLITLTATAPGEEGKLLTLTYTDTNGNGGAVISGSGTFSWQAPDKTLYNTIIGMLQSKKMELYPSASMAGICARVDRQRGVWKAPANVDVRGVSRPVVLVNAEDQGLLNVDPTSGKSINAIRFFQGKGNLVWGARTLAGNDNEWKYIPVRRLYIFVEESVKKATEFVVFEPNDANTWLRVKTMIENFLSNLWRDGALAGAKAEDAFFVNVGLGKTMTALDILEGRLIVEIGMAAVRPAEFIILKFSHKLQES
ncbi:phage tail sheath subtilisin-like domain-containing protein [Algoriphagus halophytocola]|uniref:Phage tail sheath subtilisin-like domain-containing protein n=1 Tax=Algoriphagus halophytocola TaxID=2991499 RepID=A0ABY6MFJ2_9BACT|nr:MULTISPECIES: phage tail sheath C-terminal domain-containing protein [unclassified Algoriphagus]UZD21715.1 phage tail sheath subtilisin-like domain-containing protein [Algoriphagus sp. TR-M5]WBL42927.1 phage tail sheath subtilisin-like domain-containing protein [Algoriphagus sp. TR-M9]